MSVKNFKVWGTQIHNICIYISDKHKEVGKGKITLKDMRTGRRLNTEMFATRPRSLLKADHRFDCELPTSQNKEENKITCMIRFPCVRHKSVL